MKVDRIRLNCRQKRPVEGSSGTEPSLFFIRTPAIFTTAEGEVRIDGPSAVIFTSGYRQSIRPAGEQDCGMTWSASGLPQQTGSI